MKSTNNNDETSSTPSEKSSSVVNDDDALGKNAPVASIRKLLSLARPEAPVLVFAIFLMVLAEATSLLNPLLLAQAYDILVDPEETDPMPSINRIMVLVLIIHLVGVLLGFLRASLMGITGERVVARTRNSTYAAILAQEIGFFDSHKSGELISRLSSDAAVLQQGTAQALPEIAMGFIKVVVSIGIMFYISPKLAGFMICFVFLILIVCVPFGRLLGRLSKKYQDVLGEAQTFSTEALGAMRTVQSFAAETREEIRYKKLIGEPDSSWWPKSPPPTTYSVGIWKNITMVALFSLIFGVGFGGLYACLWYGFKLIVEDEISLGMLTAFQSYVFQIGGASGHTSQFISKLLEAQGAAARIFVLLERVPTIPTPQAPDDPDPLKPPIIGSVTMESVCFAYPTRPHVQVLRDVTLSIAPNTTTAIVGSSGAGKSTIIALLQRFYDVTDGRILIDGYDIRQIDVSWLRKHLSYVQQEPQLFGVTIAENITYGLDRSASMEEIEAVAQKAHASEFIESFPDKYETLVGERGIQLSGGQKQRSVCFFLLELMCKCVFLFNQPLSLTFHLQNCYCTGTARRSSHTLARRSNECIRYEFLGILECYQINNDCVATKPFDSHGIYIFYCSLQMPSLNTWCNKPSM